MSRVRPRSRHRSRELALQVLFALDLGGDAPEPQQVFDRVAENFEMPEGARAFAEELVRSVCERSQELDDSIAAVARNWKLSRMGVVERNVLRLATYELRFTETPVPVVLDEAVELARRFGGEASPGFVNGVLDAVARPALQARP